MAKVRIKKNKIKKNKIASKNTTPTFFQEPILGRIIDGFILIFLYFYFRKLILDAGGAILFTDECYYAALSEKVSKFIYPEALYNLFRPSGLPSHAPPLLYLLAGFLSVFFGNAVFPYINIIISFGIFSFLYFFSRKYLDAYIGRIAILILATSELYFSYSERFYAEILTSGVFLIFIFLLYASLTKPTKRLIIYTGIAGGAFILSKQTGIMSYLVIFFCLSYSAIIKNFKNIRNLILITLIIIITALPHYLMMYFLTGNPFYPWLKNIINPSPYNFPIVPDFEGAPDYWARDKIKIIFSILKQLGIFIQISFFFIITWLLKCFKNSSSSNQRILGILFISIISIFSAFLTHKASEPRHFTQFAPVLSLFGAISIYYWLEQLRFKKLFAVCLVLILLVFNFLNFTQYHNYRNYFNIPKQLRDGFKFLKEKTPKDATVLVVWNYNTYYTSKRKTVWMRGEKNSPENPWELFVKRTPEYFLANLKKYNVNYIYIDKSRIIPHYMLNMYPSYMIDNINKLLNAKKVKIVFDSKPVAIVQVL